MAGVIFSANFKQSVAKSKEVQVSTTVKKRASSRKTSVKKSSAKRPARKTTVRVVDYVPSEEAIRLRAYEIYERNGCQPGREVENWLQAERELLRA